MIVVDSSVALKWFREEPGSDLARGLIYEKPSAMAAPDLLLYEFCNVLALSQLSLNEIFEALERLYQLNLQFFIQPAAGFRRAIGLSRQFGISVYDASFVALAESLNIDLVTADQKLARKVNSLPFVYELGGY
ncbi:MAG: type II toxin-antitoxin system VapC family toxin [Deltaproteobacteria bacterium]|nr:type II toxin-antitoxin system VapC family toxin [Deltaproteobacteria bacterium]